MMDLGQVLHTALHLQTLPANEAAVMGAALFNNTVQSCLAWLCRSQSYLVKQAAC